ncbi:MAG TPA: hypothetical protein VNA57_14120 [Acidimicrobiales bacterium]|nr:hypothetical protein [Acidimicrobiales bacterium]
MPPDRPHHSVAPDIAELLDALAVPFGTYYGVASCYPVPGARRLADLVADLLCALGKTGALTRQGRLGVDIAELWLRAHEVRRLFVAGADGMAIGVWRELCELGDRLGIEVAFVCADPSAWQARLPGTLAPCGEVGLLRDPDHPDVPPPVGTALPDAAFPTLPAACSELLEPLHAARAQEIYDGCLLAAFDALTSDRLLNSSDGEHALRSALARTPDAHAVPLATHAVRAAGLLRGYDIGFSEIGGVNFDDLLTADRLDQLDRLLSPEAAAAGVLAGMSSGCGGLRSIADNSAWVRQDDNWEVVPARGRPLLRAWQLSGGGNGVPNPTPRRPVDPRRSILWTRPPPHSICVSCEPIDCRTFRRIGDPPMRWARPPRARRRR